MQMIVALHPIHVQERIEEIVISTYQSVSGTGQRAIQELRDQSAAVLKKMDAGKDARLEDASLEAYPHQIAFNALPQVDVFEDNGYTGEETKLMNETLKILDKGPSDIAITATCVRVPVFKAHSESVRVRTSAPISADAYRELLRETPGVVVEDDPARGEYPLAVEAAGKDDVFVGRIRNDLGPDGDRCLNMWIVGDNLRKGAATNAVQIAEVLAGQRRLGREDRAAADSMHGAAKVLA
jgi:aspartate-semialdehyde dehydrogenase